VLSVLCIELAAEVAELDQLLQAPNPNNIEQNGKYIKYLFNYILLYILVVTYFSNFTNRSEYVAVTQPCTNCGMSASGQLCRICTDNPECRRCHRRLPLHLFEGDSDQCRACRRINPNNLRRFALGHLVREAVWTGQPEDIDVAEFVRNHTVDIVAAYDDTVRSHV